MMQGFQNRRSPPGGVEDFPTPPWATRALMEHVMGGGRAGAVVWEPAANRGHMVKPLREYFDHVIGSDLIDYGAGFPVVDFLTGPTPLDYGMKVDWIVTNPPFNKSEEFAQRALSLGVDVVALFQRASWAEGMTRYANLFKPTPPTMIAQFTERAKLVRGRLASHGGSQMPYAWFIWDRTGPPRPMGTEFRWIPPCRKALERDDDYPPEPEKGPLLAVMEGTDERDAD